MRNTPQLAARSFIVFLVSSKMLVRIQFGLLLKRRPLGRLLFYTTSRNDTNYCSQQGLTTMESVLVSWSGGKDSAIALYEILKSQKYQISALLTTVTEDFDRISMHGVRRILLERQVASLGFPLEKVFISKNASTEEYESNMEQVLAKYKDAGVTSVVFGDIFLEDLRKYRENKLATLDLKGIFPIWKRDPHELAHSFIALNFKAITTCVDTNTLGRQFVGRVIDEQFLSELPPTVDVCGENGEYHSFVYDGPIFKKKISYALGEIVLRENRFYYCDLIPD
jgi:uncharacterized protein (TIGR00290 family)